MNKLKVILKAGTFFKFELITLVSLITILLSSIVWYSISSIKSNNKLTNDILNVQNDMIEFTYKSSKFFSTDIEKFNYLIHSEDVNTEFSGEYISNIISFSNYLQNQSYYSSIDSILHKKAKLYYEYINTINKFKNIHDDTKYDLITMNTEYNMEILGKILSSNGLMKEFNTQKILKITGKIRENHIKMLITFSIISPIMILFLVLLAYDINKIIKEQFRKDNIISTLMNKKEG